MSDEEPLPAHIPEPQLPELPVPEPPAPVQEREPFWGYADLAMFLGLTLPCLAAGWALVKAILWVFRIHPAVKVAELLADQLVFYVLLFFALSAILRLQYGRPFWRSLGWVDTRLPAMTIVVLGVLTAVAVALASVLLRTPEAPNPMTEMMRDTRALIPMGIFGVTIAPLFEELAFRGFLQPLLVRSLGVLAGIFVSAAAFGILHFQEYGNSWRHAVVISLAGAAFGCMRYVTRSTKASVIMHAAYNGFLFLALLSQRKDLPHLW
jgi:membrane protease YdiL (CAAX protease family)